MRVSSFCGPCKAKRFYEVTCLSTPDEGKRRRVFAKVLSGIRRAIEEGDCPSFAGTTLSELIMRETGNENPYRKKKRDVIAKANRIYHEFERWVLAGETDYERFRRALMLAIAGNALELSAPNFEVNLQGLKRDTWKLLRSRPEIDDVRKVYSRILKAKDVLYLCDNCGEAVFDRALIAEIGKKARVTIAVNSVPMDEDVSLLEVDSAGLSKLAPVIGKGRSYGVWKREAPKAFWAKLECAGFVVGKGMANYETMDEYKKMLRGRAACLFIVKCQTVEKSVGVRQGKIVAKAL